MLLGSSAPDNIHSPIHPLTFKPEYIEAFELGTKNTLLDGSLTLNGDVFYYNYTGYQISEIVDRTAINNNYNAHVEGAELEANWEPLPGLKFNFAGGWEDTAAAGGDSGIDLMDRTAGMPGWMVVKPFVDAGIELHSARPMSSRRCCRQVPAVRRLIASGDGLSALARSPTPRISIRSRACPMCQTRPASAASAARSAGIDPGRLSRLQSGRRRPTTAKASTRI